MMKSNNNIVEITNVSKKYDHNYVIKDISLTIKAGARIGIVGPNGSGKTTLCEMIAQLRKPTSGTIWLQDHLTIGMQLQESKYPKGITGWDMAQYYLRTYRLNKSIADIQKLLYYLDIGNLINKPIATLSGGQQQKINLLLALIVEPQLLICDELATGLDIEVRDRIYSLLTTEILQQKALALLIVSHNMSEIERFCDEVIFMFGGKIISVNDVANLVKDYGSIENYVTAKFKEYKIGMYDQGQLAKQLGSDNNDKWVKSWKKRLKKQQKQK